jgi:hypothetical protein
VIQPDQGGSSKSERRKPAAAKKAPTPAPVAASTAKHRGTKRGAKPKAAVGGSAAKRFPTAWVVVGVSGGSVLGLMILLFSLLGGPSGDAPTGSSPSGGRSAAAPVGASRSLPTFQSEIPVGTGGVRPMDAAEKARRRERIASFAEMAREQEAELEKEKTPAQP